MKKKVKSKISERKTKIFIITSIIILLLLALLLYSNARTISFSPGAGITEKDFKDSDFLATKWPNYLEPLVEKEVTQSLVDKKLIESPTDFTELTAEETTKLNQYKKWLSFSEDLQFQIKKLEIEKELLTTAKGKIPLYDTNGNERGAATVERERKTYEDRITAIDEKVQELNTNSTRAIEFSQAWEKIRKFILPLFLALFIRNIILGGAGDFIRKKIPGAIDDTIIGFLKSGGILGFLIWYVVIYYLVNVIITSNFLFIQDILGLFERIVFYISLQLIGKKPFNIQINKMETATYVASAIVVGALIGIWKIIQISSSKIDLGRGEKAGEEAGEAAAETSAYAKAFKKSIK